MPPLIDLASPSGRGEGAADARTVKVGGRRCAESRPRTSRGSVSASSRKGVRKGEKGASRGSLFGDLQDPPESVLSARGKGHGPSRGSDTCAWTGTAGVFRLREQRGATRRAGKGALRCSRW
jgi:hypothetical protein